MSEVYKQVKLTGPIKSGNNCYFQITFGGDYNFPGPLAVNSEFALIKAKEIVDEVFESQHLRNPSFIGSKPYNQFSVCPNCGKGNRNDRLKCWNCNWDLVALDKPHFGPPSGKYKKIKFYDS